MVNTSVIQLRSGDCVEVLRDLPENSVGAIITDPPYLIGFMNRDWDADLAGDEKVKWHLRWLSEAVRVLVPGGILKVFTATRTSHWLNFAMDQAGLVYDPHTCIEAWQFGTGFPKYLDTHKQVADTTSEFEGWATALKPGWEPFLCRRKP